ncbi:SCO5918 family protein [Streptacidiphilus sp. EB129]|uniref:SCO5918 family protein n=1 Tax=Streptacidiphilus sp. EB129 TaxID=3156262 RepID=UPI0035155B33
MRCTIAGHSFYLQASEVEAALSGIKPEPITGSCVRIGRRWYPVKQVGAVVTRQDRRDFSAAEVMRALQGLGFTCAPTPPDAS